jgi:hypothetical protein
MKTCTIAFCPFDDPSERNVASVFEASASHWLAYLT